MPPRLKHNQKVEKLIDDLNYLTTSEIDALLATTKAFKEREELGGAPTPELFTELKKCRISNIKTQPKRS